MQLILSHTQRLNVHFIAGSQKGTVDEIRAYWSLQDMVQLTEEEKQSINYSLIRNGDGSSYPRWDVEPAAQTKAFEVTQEQMERLSRLVKGWPTYSGLDRAWLEPLLAQLETTSNGKGTGD